MEIFVSVLVVAVVLIGFSIFAGRRRRELQQKVQAELSTDGVGAEDFVAPRPKVAEFHVRGEQAIVTFDVPLPDGEVDEVLADLLVTEAVEVVREKSQKLPIDQVTTVVAVAGMPDHRVEVGRRSLETPGVLPPPVGIDHMLHFAKIGYDPLVQQFEEASPAARFEAPPADGDELPPVGRELRLPKAIEVGLRTQGVDPETVSAGELVRTLLALFGYRIMGGEKPNTYFAERGGQRTYIREEPYEPGGYPELEERIINQFMADFASSGADRGLLVTDKYGPFMVYEKEKREPRVRFVTRERLQKFVDSMALG